MTAANPNRARAALHHWVGALAGWLLFPVALTGTLIVFAPQIDRWMKPEAVVAANTDALTAIATADAWLSRNHPDASMWEITPPSARGEALAVSWTDRNGVGQRLLDPATGDLLRVRDTVGSRFLIDLHYTLHADDIGLWLVATLGVLMLVAILSGILIHKRIVRDYFVLRPGKGRRSWLDLHNVAGVATLPFQVMIAYTGLVFSLTTLMPAPLQALYGTDIARFYDEAVPHVERDPARAPGRLMPLNELARRAQAEFTFGPVLLVSIHDPADRAAVVDVFERTDEQVTLAASRISFDGVTGAVVQRQFGYEGGFGAQSFLSGLHFGRFGGAALSWLYFISGTATCILIATGLQLFVARQAGQTLFARVASRLNVIAIAGSILSVTALMWANRLLPLDVPSRAGWEATAFLLALSASALHAGLRPANGAFRTQTLIASGLLALLPFLDAVSTRGVAVRALMRGDPALAAVDFVAATLALGLALAVLTRLRVFSRTTVRGKPRGPAC